MLDAMPRAAPFVRVLFATALALTIARPIAVAQPTPALERVSGSCGEITRGTQPAPLAVSATVRRGIVRLRLRNYVFYCAPPPDFHVVVAPRRSGVPRTPITLTGFLTPGVPRATCTCTHQLSYTLRGLPPGTYELRIEAGDSRLPTRPPGAAATSYLAVEVVIP